MVTLLLFEASKTNSFFMPPKTLVWNEDQLIVLLKLTMKHQAFMVTEGDSLTNKFHRVHRDCLKNPLFEGLIMPQPETLHGKVERLLKDVERIFFEERINLSGLDEIKKLSTTTQLLNLCILCRNCLTRLLELCLFVYCTRKSATIPKC